MHHKHLASALGFVAVICTAHATSSIPFRLAPYSIGMTKAQAKAAGYRDCKPHANSKDIVCQATTASVFTPDIQWLTTELIFGGPEHGRVQSIRLTNNASKDRVVQSMKTTYGTAYSERRGYVFIDPKDLTATIHTRAVSDSSVTISEVPGAYAQAKKAAQPAPLETKAKGF